MRGFTSVVVCVGIIVAYVVVVAVLKSLLHYYYDLFITL